MHFLESVVILFVEVRFPHLPRRFGESDIWEQSVTQLWRRTSAGCAVVVGAGSSSGGRMLPGWQTSVWTTSSCSRRASFPSFSVANSRGSCRLFSSRARRREGPTGVSTPSRLAIRRNPLAGESSLTRGSRHSSHRQGSRFCK